MFRYSLVNPDILENKKNKKTHALCKMKVGLDQDQAQLQNCHRTRAPNYVSNRDRTFGAVNN